MMSESMEVTFPTYPFITMVKNECSYVVFLGYSHLLAVKLFFRYLCLSISILRSVYPSFPQHVNKYFVLVFSGQIRSCYFYFHHLSRDTVCTLRGCQNRKRFPLFSCNFLLRPCQSWNLTQPSLDELAQLLSFCWLLDASHLGQSQASYFNSSCQKFNEDYPNTISGSFHHFHSYHLCYSLVSYVDDCNQTQPPYFAAYFSLWRNPVKLLRFGI